MKKSMKNSLSFIISLLTMFAIFVASISLFLNKIILNEQTYTKILQQENIPHQIKSHIEESLSYLLISNNIPSDILDDIISQDEIEENLNNYVYYTVGIMKNKNGEINSVDMTIYEKRIDERINDFINKNKENINDEFYGNLANFRASALKIISSSLEVIDLNKLSTSQSINLVAKISTIVSGVKFLGLTILSIIILSITHFAIWIDGRKNRRYAWMSYPFISSGMILFLIGFSGYISKFYENVAINTFYLKNTSITIMETYLLSLTYLGIGVFILGLALISIYWKHLFKTHKA